MIGTDFLIHGGILANTYIQKSPFLLPAEDAFIRIPLGYLSFIFLAILLYYVLTMQQNTTRLSGLKTGLVVGGLVWVSFALGLFSISTASSQLLIGWFIGQTMEMAIGGYFMGICIEGVKKRKVFLWVFLYCILMIILTIVLQSIGWAPSMQTI